MTYLFSYFFFNFFPPKVEDSRDANVSGNPAVDGEMSRSSSQSSINSLHELGVLWNGEKWVDWFFLEGGDSRCFHRRLPSIRNGKINS
jgi:hypothetical protein